MTVRWVSGAMLAILASPGAADECGDLRFALAREEVAERLFQEQPSDAAGQAWQEAIDTTEVTADSLARGPFDDERWSYILKHLRFALAALSEASHHALRFSEPSGSGGGVIPKPLLPMVNTVLDADTATREAYHSVLLTLCGRR